MISSLKDCGKPLLLFMFLAALLLPGRASAQRGNDMTRAAALLPPALRSVVDRLSSLRALPDGPWKFHVGDIAFTAKT